MKIKLFTIPNLLTLGNLMCGAFATVAALVDDNLPTAFYLVVLAAVFDFLDGFVARLLHSASPIGGELDSLADVISFGLAPAAILHAMYLGAEPHWAWSETTLAAGGLALFVLVAFSALRLAKFNIDDTQHTEFCGLPTPAAAMLSASLGWLAARGTLEMSPEAILLLAAVLSLLLVSPIRMFALKFRGFGWRGNELRYLFLTVCAALLLAMGLGSIPLIILLYILTSLVRWLLCRRRTCGQHDLNN